MAKALLRRSARGFSLVELLVALVFTMVLMAGMANVYKASLTTYYTSGESLSSARRNRMSVDLLVDDLNTACMYLTDLSVPPTVSAAVPPIYILPLNTLSSITGFSSTMKVTETPSLVFSTSIDISVKYWVAYNFFRSSFRTSWLNLSPAFVLILERMISVLMVLLFFTPIAVMDLPSFDGGGVVSAYKMAENADIAKNAAAQPVIIFRFIMRSPFCFANQSSSRGMASQEFSDLG